MLGTSTLIILFIGRLMLSLFFLMSGISKITRNKKMVEYAASKKLPMPSIAIILAAFVELGGGFAILTGFHSNIAALILFVYLLPTSIIFHNFWTLAEPEKQNQIVHFMKNVCIMGGLLILASFS
jgi:putative oxidoreductase